MTPAREISRLIEIMAALRHPETGCPWDIVQDFRSIAPYTIEEAHEVADAIRRNDLIDLRDELGDLLLQVVYHARMAEEVGAFRFEDVVLAITTKLIRRHPHVFGGAEAQNPAAVKSVWEAIKAEEKTERRQARAAAGLADDTPQGLLGGVKGALPAFAEAVALQQKAATVGFDWNDVHLVLDKIEEETAELRQALNSSDQTEIAGEIGDILFAAVNVARHVGIDPDEALRRTNAKFRQRFSAIEAALAREGRDLREASLEEMEAHWIAAKRQPARTP